MISQLSIIAPGLLGASVAKAVHEKGLPFGVEGSAAHAVLRTSTIWARREEVRRAIVTQPWCDTAPETLSEAVRETSPTADRANTTVTTEAPALVADRAAPLVVIAAPVTHIVPLLRQLAPHLPAGAIVTDVGSVKGKVCREAHAVLAEAAPHAHFVGSHPMAGSEKTGWEHAQADLFEGRTCFVTPFIETDQNAPHEAAQAATSALARAAVETVTYFWQALGSKVVRAAPDKHDEIVAHISHLPHALASTLCAALAQKNEDWHAYAGGGLRDTTRIAGSDPQLWRSIFEQNRDAVLHALDGFEAELRGFRDALTARDYDTVTDTLARGQHYRQQFRS